MFEAGDTVRFATPGLVERHGGGPFTVAEVEVHTGGLRLRELPGLTFDPADFAGPGVQKGRRSPSGGRGGAVGAPDPSESRTGGQRASDGRLIEAVDRLSAALPDPSLGNLEAGFKEASFYRFPVSGRCWCGKPKRYTLDGVLCEDGHR